jgi:hypothetical protein
LYADAVGAIIADPIIATDTASRAALRVSGPRRTFPDAGSTRGLQKEH